VTTGSAVVDFGSTPTHNFASLAITGQTAITTADFVEAWPPARASADHSSDEHRVEDLQVIAGDIVAGVGFTIYVRPRLGTAWGRYNVDWVWE
jgi:hypothetical protein